MTSPSPAPASGDTPPVRSVPMRRRVAVGVVLICVIAGAWRWATPPEAPEVELATPQPRVISDASVVTGRVQPRDRVDISADISGRVISVRVHEGDLVHEGDVLVVIDPDELGTTVDRARADLAAAQSSADASEVRLLKAEQTLRRVNMMRATHPQLVAASQVEDAETDDKVARAELAGAKHAVERGEAQLHEAQHQLEKTTIRAPMAGVVTRLSITTGEAAVTGGFNKLAARLMTIADLAALQLRARVDETDVVNVHVGDSAAVSLDALPRTPIAAHVLRISRSAVEIQNGGGGPQNAQYEVILALHDPPPTVRPDFTGNGRIFTMSRTAPVAIPVTAVLESADAATGADSARSAAPAHQARGGDAARSVSTGRVFVLPWGASRVVERRIELGASDEDFVEVRRGLRPRDRVVVGPVDVLHALAPDAQVRARTP